MLFENVHGIFKAAVVGFTGVQLLALSSSAVKIIPSPGTLPTTIPAACRASLATEIACGPRLIHASDLEREVPYNETFLSEYCNSTCTESIQKFTDTVGQRCGDILYDFGGGIQQSGNAIAAPLKWAHDVSCITSSNEEFQFCLPEIFNHTLELCDTCTLKYLAGLSGSPYGSRKVDEEGFSSLVSSCSADPTDFPHATTTLSLPMPTTTPGPNITCWGGQEYIVQAADSCTSIAEANSMAIDRLLYLNSLDFKCETLTEGASLCIRDSCTLHEIQPGETCKQIISNQAFGMPELIQWNPVLESGCDNMTIMEGRTICITPPGSDSYDVTITATFNNTWTWPAGSWVPGPTQGTPLNMTTEWVTAIPTTTMTTGEGPAPTDYFANCPLDDDVYDTGFDWEMLSEECKELLSPYCDPVLAGTPLPSTTFPSSCFFMSVTESTETATSVGQAATNTTTSAASSKGRMG